jgi:hypothetical protein
MGISANVGACGAFRYSGHGIVAAGCSAALLALLAGCAAQGDQVTRITHARAGGIVRAIQGEASTCTFRTNDDGVTVRELVFDADGCRATMRRDWQIGVDYGGPE